MVDTTIVIPHWNRIDLLCRCLDSLRGQEGSTFEIVVVDNGSTDGTVERLRETYGEVKLLELGENRGFAGAVNEGIERSDGEYVIVLNNDLVCSSGFVSRLVETLGERPDVDWAAPLTLRRSEPSVIDNCGLEMSFVGIARKRMAGRSADDVRPESEVIFGASGNAVAFRRDFFGSVGLFDRRFFAYCEDWDLAFRAGRLGKRCLFVPRATCFHDESSTWGPNSDPTVYYFQRNMELAYFGSGRLGFHARYLVPHMAYSALCVLRWIRRGKGRLVLAAKRDALRMILGRDALPTEQVKRWSTDWNRPGSGRRPE